MTENRPVSVLDRPPVRRSTLVPSGAEHTFAVFVREIGVWWPRQPYSVGGERVRDVTVEPRLDGRVFETWEDGTWEDGTWEDGTWEDGTWEDGTWEDGTWEDGTEQSGGGSWSGNPRTAWS